MRIKLDLLNVSSKPLLRVDTGNLSETCGMSNAENKCLSVGYQLTHTVRWRTSSNGTKAYPTIHTSLLLSSTGDYLTRMPTMAMRNALIVINHKAMLSEMTLKIWQGNGAFIVV